MECKYRICNFWLSIASEKVKIEFGISVNTINRYNDLDLFSNREKYTVIYDGGPKNKIINEYGENDFLLTYDNRYYYSFRHFKLNRRHQHDYHFDLYQIGNEIFVTVNVFGENPMEFDRQLINMDMAEQFRCNRPINELIELENE